MLVTLKSKEMLLVTSGLKRLSKQLELHKGRMMLYRGMDRAALDVAYDNVAAIGQEKFKQYVVDRGARTKALAERVPLQRDLRYGDGDRQRLDFYPCGKPGAPTLFYIHGGYWQMMNKEDYGFLAEGLLTLGVNVMMMEYTLAPAIRMAGIVAEVKRAVSWTIDHLGELGAARDGIYVAGHSAGGHLTAMVSAEPGVKGAMSISGIFDLEPIRLSYLNDKVRMDEAEARLHSPILNLPNEDIPFVLSVGGEELPELRRQSEEYAAARVAKGFEARYLPLPGHDHFSILEELATADGKLTRALIDIIR
jgi:acetyl esterase/lipase